MVRFRQLGYAPAIREKLSDSLELTASTRMQVLLAL